MRILWIAGMLLPLLADTWEIRGVVSDGRGPRAALMVQLSGPSPASTRTDSSGRFHFSGSVPGVYTVTVARTDYNMAQPRTHTFRVQNGQKLVHDFLLPAGGEIAGRVLDTDEVPLSGVMVQAYLPYRELGKQTLNRQSEALTDERGFYRFAHLPEGNYVVGVAPAVRKPLSIEPRARSLPESLAASYPPLTFAPFGGTLDQAARVQIGDAQQRSGVDITVRREPRYCIFFRVQPPVGGTEAQALLVTVSPWVGARAGAVANGKVHAGEEQQVCGLPDGDYRIDAVGFAKGNRGTGYGSAQVNIAKKHANAGAIIMEPMADLRGVLTVRDGKPGVEKLDGIKVSYRQNDRPFYPGDFPVARVDTDGRFLLPGLYPGSYTPWIFGLPDRWYVARADQNGRDILDGGVRTGGGDVGVEVRTDGPTLSGRVLTKDQQPVGDASVLLLTADGREPTVVQTDQDGAYSFHSGLAPGDYRLVAVEYLTPAERRDEVRLGELARQGIDVKLKAGEAQSTDLAPVSR